MRYATLVTLAACSMATPLAAQRLVGLTARTATGSTTITMQSVCEPPVALCQAVPPPPATPYAGGAAHNPLWDGVFYTDGDRIWEQRLTGCPVTCTMDTSRALGPGSIASGLAIDPARRELLELETIAGFASVTTWGPVSYGVCPDRISNCRFQLPSARYHAGAIAFDQKRDLIWIACSQFSATTATSVLLVYRRTDPICRRICTLAVNRCLAGTLGPIRAMAYDECADRIYLSDGRRTSVQDVRWSPTSSCPVLAPVECCVLNHPTGESWVGFDLRPAQPRQLGTSCTSQPCPSCPAMALGTIGFPVVGNPEFRYLITGAPAGSTGYVFFHLGACGSATPFFCGQLWLNLNAPLGQIGPHNLFSSTGTCGGAGAFYLAIPNNFSLCGVLVCSQGVVLCPTSGQLGVGLTNALVTPIGS